ncbi:MAG: rRNA maturation RNase YbeY [Calditerrivibrio sp.]|nr:rRNA maturation RNase YbeY [Calditerrivibrio sp.]MCA1932519.1 rRNA maturation RNase YbeY [Calditerrivibrio sp.]MCA1980185.1 rRNA maturation RNase YbeY [Calditerrivibrio sp.]
MEIILLMDNEKGYDVDKSFFTDIAKVVLTDERVKYPFNIAEISMVLTDDKEMQEINRLYRKIDKPTDVLSFPINENKTITSKLLGDIVISIDRVKSQAAESGCTEKEEIAYLFIHGLLHLLTFDHETSEDDEEEMFAIQDSIFDKIFT